MWVIEPQQEDNKNVAVGAISNQSQQQEPRNGGEALSENNAAKLPEGAGSLSLRDLHSNNNNGHLRSPLQYGAGEESDGPMSAGSSFLSILERELVHPTTFTQTFLQSILSSIDSRDPVVANAWLETLLDVIDLLPSDVIRNEILNIAISKGQISQPLCSRIACCKLLGKIASKFEPYLTQQEVLPLVLSLCQDVQCEVRAHMCSQLPALARGLGCELARPSLLPSLVELASDEEPQVRLAAVQAVADILGLLDHESRQQIIVPLVRKLCESALRSEDAVLLAVAKQIGYLCYSLSDQMCVDDTRWFLHFYLKLSQLGAPLAPSGLGPMPDIVPILDRADLYAEVRYLCAFNLPGMMVVGNRVEADVLRRIFCELASDICYNVRRTIAACLHEVARMLGADGYGAMVRSQLAGLLCDSAEEVLEALVPHLGTTLELLAKSGALKSSEEPAAVLELCRALLHCEEEVSQTNNWRLQTNMLEQLACLPHCVSTDLIFTHFVPRMFTKMHKARPLPCRVAAARALLTYLHHLSEEKHRAGVLARLEAEFVRGESCYSRMLFLRMCPDAMTILSPPFFKQNLFCSVLKLAGDPVANIQLEVCSLLCPLKQMLRLPLDRHLLHELESCVGSLLLSAKDRDVNAALAMAIQQLDKIELPPASLQHQDLEKSSNISARMDVTRRSLSSQHRNSGVSRPMSSLSMRGMTPDLSKGSATSRRPSEPQPDNRSISKLRKPTVSTQDTKIPLSTIKNVSPGIRKLTRCLSANSMIPPPPPTPTTQLCTQCKLPRAKPKLERSHTTLAVGKNWERSSRPLPTDPVLLRNYYQLSLSLLESSKFKPPLMDYSQIDPSTDEFYIDAGIRITPNSNNMTKIPNLQDIYQQRMRKSTENENKMESVRSRLELNQISSKKLGQQQRLVKPLTSKISNSRDNSPGGKSGNLNKSTTTTPPVTMRNQIRPQSVSSNSRKSLNLERNVTRRSLPPQDRVPINSQKRQTTRPQSCLIVEPPKRPESKHHRSLSEESLQTLSPPPPPTQRNSRLTVTKIPKVTSPNPSRATSPGIEALKYTKNTTNKGVDLKLKQSIGVKSTPVSRDPSPNNLDLKLVSNTRKSQRMQQPSFQQKRPGPSYTAPSSRGSSPENSHRYLLSSIRQSSMPASPNSPLPPSRLPVPNLRYQWLSHDFG